MRFVTGAGEKCPAKNLDTDLKVRPASKEMMAIPAGVVATRPPYSSAYARAFEVMRLITVTSCPARRWHPIVGYRMPSSPTSATRSVMCRPNFLAARRHQPNSLSYSVWLPIQNHRIPPATSTPRARW